MLTVFEKKTKKIFPPQSRRLHEDESESGEYVSSSEESQQPQKPKSVSKRPPVLPPKIINKIPIDKDMCGPRNIEAEFVFMKTFGDDKKSKNDIVKILCSDFCQKDQTDANECQDARTAVGRERSPKIILFFWSFKVLKKEV